MVEGYDIIVRWVSFPLHPETPPEGRSLEELFAGQPIDLEQVKKRLSQVAEAEGLPFSPGRGMTYNSRLAQELGKWAEEQGLGEEFHEAAFRAYFVDNRNIGLIEELVDLAESIGLDGAQAKKVLAERTCSAQVDEDWAYSREHGVMAVPTFMAGGRKVVGAQPYETLAQLVEAAGAKPRN